jgi:hypothetical protein
MAAAFTPVVVSLVKEALHRPMESEVVRRPVQRIAETRPRVATREREPVYSGTGGRSHFDDEPPEMPSLGYGEPPPAEMSPVRTYGKSRRRWHIKAAIVTGIVGFVIAALVLTVPELVFGGSVAGKGKTTFFSTTKAKSADSDKKSDEQSQKDEEQTSTSEDEAPPAQQPQGEGSGGSGTPEEQSAPSQQQPEGGTPAPPQAPAPAAPPAGSPSP